MYQFTGDEKQMMRKIRANPYMERTLELIEDYVKKSNLKPENACKSVFDELYTILNQAKPFVNDYLATRKKQNPKYDVQQAIKSIAGTISNKAMPSKNSPSNVPGKTADTMLSEYIVVCEKMV